MDFQKLLFLYCQDTKVSTYEFVPYKYGGFSFTSYADKRRLIERGMLTNDEHSWSLTKASRAAAVAPLSIRQRMEQFARSHKGLRGDDLVAESYRRYPYYAIHSEMATRVLANDKATLAAIEAARPAKGKPGICTIGYEGRSVENYLNHLIQDGVTLLCDVRRNPLSRKYGFSKSTLAKGCEGVSIRYEHLPELGIASEARRGLESQEDYDVLFAEYERETLPRQTTSLTTISHWVAEGHHVALTCFEREAHRCHRHCVAEAMEERFGTCFKPRHL